MRELRPGLWHWQAPHPGWSPDSDGWERDVSSYAWDAGDAVFLFDPLDPPEELVAGRSLVVVLTVGSHSRSAAELSERGDALARALG